MSLWRTNNILEKYRETNEVNISNIKLENIYLIYLNGY